MNKQSYKILAKHFSDSINIVLTFKKDAIPSTNGKEIILPENLNPNYIDCTLSALLHETSHIRYSNFNALLGLNKIEGHCLNVLEDIRCDFLTMETYPNVKEFYQKFLTDTLTRNKEKLHQEKIPFKILKGLIFSFHGFNIEKIYGKNIFEIVEKLKPFITRATLKVNTNQLILDAKELVKLLFQELLNQENQQSNQGNQDNQGNQENSEGQQSNQEGSNQEGSNQEGSNQEGQQSNQDKLEKIQEGNQEIENLEKEINSENSNSNNKKETSDKTYQDYKTTRRKARIHSTKLRKLKRENAPTSKIEDKEKQVKELTEQLKNDIQKSNQAYREYRDSYSSQNQTKDSIRRKKLEVEQLQNNFIDNSEDVKISGFDALDVEKTKITNNLEINITPNFSELIKDALIKKQLINETNENGRFLNPNNFDLIYTNPDEIIQDKTEQNKKTSIHFLVDVSGSMGFAEENLRLFSRATLTINALGKIVEGLENAIKEGIDLNFTVYGFANGVKLLFTDETYKKENLIPSYNNLQKKIGDRTILTTSINFLLDEIQFNYSDSENIIIILTDVGIGNYQIKQLTNEIGTGDTRILLIAIDGDYQNNPDAVNLFKDNNITSIENSTEILEKALIEFCNQ